MCSRCVWAAVRMLDGVLSWAYRSIVHFVTGGQLKELWNRFMSRGNEEADKWGFRGADVGGVSGVGADAGAAAGDDDADGGGAAQAQQRARERHQAAELR
jgi:hypothetical protein